MLTMGVKSIMVPFGYEVELYSSDGFTGQVQIFKGLIYRNNFNEMLCQDVQTPIDEDYGSARILRTGEYEPPIGYWEGVTHTQDIDVVSLPSRLQHHKLPIKLLRRARTVLAQLEPGSEDAHERRQSKCRLLLQQECAEDHQGGHRSNFQH